MKYWLLLFVFISNLVFAQSNTKVPSRALTEEDSAKVDYYWRKAQHARLGSTIRQLYLDSALAIAPWKAFLWQQKSMPLTKAFKHELAAPYLDSAVKYNPERYLDYRAYVKCMFGRRYRDALPDFYAAKVLNGNSGVMDHSYDFYIGICHLQLNNYDSARLYFQHCIDDRATRLGADWVHHLHLFYLGIVYYELEMLEKAIETFDHALRLNPTFPDVMMYKAYCKVQFSENEEALRLLYKADSLLKEGYSMNEDNTRHIMYPYQLRPYYLHSAIRRLEARKEE